MASFTTRSVVPSTTWVPNRASRPARTVICSAAAPSNFPSVEQHFGSKALEQFEKVKLEQLDTSDLASLAQELKQRAAAFNPQLPELPTLPELPLQLPQLTELRGLVGDAVTKLGDGGNSASLEALRSNVAKSLADAVPSDGAFAPHWGYDAAAAVGKDVAESVLQLIQELVNQAVAKLS